MCIWLTLGTAPGWTLFRTLQRIIPLLNPSLNSSSEGSAGKSFAATTPIIFLSHPAASFLLDASLKKEQISISIREETTKKPNKPQSLKTSIDQIYPFK